MRQLPSKAVIVLAFFVLILTRDALAQPGVLKVGVSLPITGQYASGSASILKGIQLAVEEVNAKGGAGGYKIETVVYDSASPTTGQEDPARTVANYKQFLADPLVIAAVGPATSLAGKTISPLLSIDNMATITPSSTDPEITDPKFTAQYRPKGKPIYFRTLTTDPYQAEDMATFAYRALNVRKVYVLDDGTALGITKADAFQRRAKELGLVVLGRDRVDPAQIDYQPLLKRITYFKPDAVNYSGASDTGKKLAAQAKQTTPRVPWLDSGGLYRTALEDQTAAKTLEGWYTTRAAPDVLSNSQAQPWVEIFKSRFDEAPTSYSATGYSATLVIVDAVTRLATDRAPVTRSGVRDYVQRTNLKNTPQGPISFDKNGDLKAHTVSLYQIAEQGLKFVGTSESTTRPTYTVVRVFYGTDRRRSTGAQPVGYGTDRAQAVDLGFCDVSIPRDHRMGSLEAPSILRLEFREDPAKHVILRDVTLQTAKEFNDSLRTRVNGSDRKHAFVFVHGFDVSFEDAARRTAQLSYDLAFDGAPIFFSWPSQGSLNPAAYTVDETNADWAIPDLDLFLRTIAIESGGRTVHLIAHSMGNRVLTGALRAISSSAQSSVSATFRQIVLTAPDIDADQFKREILPKLQWPGRRLTLYASSKDEALRASKHVHGYRRAGDADGNIIIGAGLDSIDATAVDTGFIGHSYYAERRSVISDLFYLVRDGKPPDQRFGLIQRSIPAGLYWEFRP